MKTYLTSTFTRILTMVLTGMIVFTSCEEKQPIAEVDSEEIAEIVGASLAKDSQGMTAQLEASAEDAEELMVEGDSTARIDQEGVCGQEFTSTFDLESQDNQPIFFDYSFEYFYSFQCNAFMVPSLMDFTMTQSGEVDAQRYGSDDSSNGGWALSGLEISSTQYAFSGDFERTGQHISKVRNQNTFDFALDIDFKNIKMNKGNYVISQGEGTFAVSGNASTGDSFNVEGSLEFLGSQQILITINEDSYIVNLRTGEVTPV